MKIFLILILISSNSFSQKQQSQVFLGIKTGFKNLFKTTTIDPIARLLNQKQNYLPSTLCSSDPYDHNKSNNNEDLTKTLEFISSECRPWSFNDKCDCSIRCPNDFNIIKYAPFNESFNVTEENSFPFRNSNGDFKNSKFSNDQGFCWGHAIGTQRFNRLAVFQDGEELVDKKGRVLKKDSKEWVAAIKKKINRVFRNHIEIFPGFNNLQDLSSTPPFDAYIKDKVAKKWANEAMSFQGLGILLNSRVDRAKKVDSILTRLIDRINQGVSPQLIFTEKDFKGFTHAVLVSDYEIKDNVISLCIRDNNYEVKSIKNCKRKMIFTKKNNQYKIEYDKMWGEIGGIRFGTNEDKDLIRQIKNAQKFCRKHLCGS